MFVKFMKPTLSAFAVLASVSSFACAGKILDFSSSDQDPETGKAIMKMIRKANPSYFKRNAEHLTNKEGKLAYTLSSNGQAESSSSKATVNYSFTAFDSTTGVTHTTPVYDGNGYHMILRLEMSGKLLTQEGRNFFSNLSKSQSRSIK
jgi:hypothetical protein